MVENAAKLTGRIDLLVNNARSGLRLNLLDETEANWHLSLTTGLTAAFCLADDDSLDGRTRRLSNCKRGLCGSGTSNLESPSYHASTGLLNDKISGCHRWALSCTCQLRNAWFDRSKDTGLALNLLIISHIALLLLIAASR